MALTLELSQLGLLRGRQDLVEGRFSLPLVRGRLSRQVANACRRLLDRGCVIALHCGFQALARGRHAAVYGGLRAGRIGEDGSSLLLLSGIQAQKSGQVTNASLHKVDGITAGGRALSD